MRSLPERMTGMACFWIGVGDLNPNCSVAFTMESHRPRLENVIEALLGCKEVFGDYSSITLTSLSRIIELLWLWLALILCNFLILMVIIANILESQRILFLGFRVFYCGCVSLSCLIGKISREKVRIVR